MELQPVDSVERLTKASKVWDQIAERNREIEEQLRNLDTVLERDTEDTSSDLSDPFSDMGDSEFAKPANKKVFSDSGPCLFGQIERKNLRLTISAANEQIVIGYIAHVKLHPRLYEGAGESAEQCCRRAGETVPRKVGSDVVRLPC